MKFQNLNEKLKKYDRAQKPKRTKKPMLKLLLWIIAVIFILAIAIYFPVRGIYAAAKELRVTARTLQESAKNENLDQIRANLKSAEGSMKKMNGSLAMLFWARFIPYFGDFYADIRHFASAGESQLNAAKTLADTLDPYKAELGFNGQPTPGQDRITQFVKVLDKVIPQLDKVEPQIKKAASEVKDINTEKYPDHFGKYKVRENVALAKDLLIGAEYAVTQARPAIEVAPAALGQPTPKNYLIIFQNDKELRATGGFMTAYAFLKLDKGRINSPTSDDIYRLDEQLLEVCKTRICPLTPPAPIAKYLPEANGKPRTAWSMRDSNLSPDLATSMKDFEKMYAFLPNQPDFDGIIMIDTHVVEELIKITGPIDIFGTKYSAETDKRCDCPNVIYELENYAQIIEKGENDRKAILGTLMQQILARSLGASTDKMPDFINVGLKLVNSKHVMFYMKDEKVQKALSDLNWTGSIKQTTGDYLHINDSNFAGGKSNLYVTQDVNLEIDTKAKEGVKHLLTINYKNPRPYNIWLNGINRDYVRIYVPQGSKLVTSKGSEQKVTTIENELGKTVFEAFIQVRPQNNLNLTFEYTTPAFTGKEYPLLIQKQPGKSAGNLEKSEFTYSIKLNGKSHPKFVLDSDKELKLGL